MAGGGGERNCAGVCIRNGRTSAQPAPKMKPFGVPLCPSNSAYTPGPMGRQVYSASEFQPSPSRRSRIARGRSRAENLMPRCPSGAVGDSSPSQRLELRLQLRRV